MTTDPGEIPPSDALSEVSLNSLTESIDRFDARIQAGTAALSEPGARRDLDIIIRNNRDLRERWAALEAASGGKAPRAVAATKTPLSRVISGKLLDDLGI